MQLSQHFSLDELTKSDTADKLGLVNQPSQKAVESLIALCQNVLEPVRFLAGRPVLITSGFRCAALNKAVGGVAKSQHQLGEAADIECPGLTAIQLFDLIVASPIPYDQIILEHPGPNAWVHISYRHKPRKQKLVIR